jgi:predicted secreted acid phosphatase
MKRAAAVALLCASLIFAQTPTVAAPDLHLDATNLSAVYQKLADYATRGEYAREISQVVAAAHSWVETRTASTKPNEKLAAVFDIDETLLSNVPNILECAFCSSSLQSQLFAKRHLPAIPPVHDLYDFAKSKNVTVILLTGRSEAGRTATIADLTAAGIYGWGDLLLRPAGNTQPAAIMKANARKGVEAKGYKIILSIGDQLSDLTGGFAERTYKLPNPFYFVE